MVRDDIPVLLKERDMMNANYYKKKGNWNYSAHNGPNKIRGKESSNEEEEDIKTCLPKIATIRELY